MTDFNDLGCGILQGEGLKRPKEVCVFIPFVETVTLVEAEEIEKLIDGELSDSHHLEEINGCIYLSVETGRTLTDYLDLKKKMDAALLKVRKVDFDSLRELVDSDERVLGLVLTGSRGKGFESDDSDYDIWLIVKDEDLVEVQGVYKSENYENIDICVMSDAEFKDYAGWGTENSWDRYDFAHCQVLIDRTGDITSITNQKGCVPEEFIKDFVEKSLDGYINAVFRSVKCMKYGNKSGTILEASNSIPHLLDAIFAFNGRVKPFLGYLEAEMEKYPLEKVPFGVKEFLMTVFKVLKTGDVRAQQKLFRHVSDFFKQNGYQHVFKEWEGKDEWIMSYKSRTPFFHDLLRLSHIENYGCMSMAGTSDKGEKFEADFLLNNFHNQRFTNKDAEKYARKYVQRISLNRQFEINQFSTVYSFEEKMRPKSSFNTLVYLNIPYTLYLPNYFAVELDKPVPCRVKFIKNWTDNSFDSDIFDVVGDKRLYYRPFSINSPAFPIDASEGWLPRFRGKNVEVRNDNTGYFRYSSLLIELDTDFEEANFAVFDSYLLLKEVVLGIVNYILSVYRGATGEIQVKSLSQISVTDVYSLKYDQGYYPVDSLLITDAVINEAQDKIDDFEQKLKDGYEVPIHEELFDNAKCAFAFQDYKMAVVEAFQALDVFLEKFLFGKLVELGDTEADAEAKLETYYQTKQRLGALLEEICGKQLDQIDSSLGSSWRDCYRNIRNKVIHSDLIPTKQQAKDCIDFNLQVVELVIGAC